MLFLKIIGYFFGSILALIIVLALSVLISTVSGTWHYKMTVNINTPEGLKSGYSVREVSNSASPILNAVRLPDTGNSAKVRGEAVVVDLGERGVLFALLKGYYAGDTERILYHVIGGDTTIEGIKSLNDRQRQPPIPVPLKDKNYYPMLATFTDLNDPRTVTPVITMKNVGEPGNVMDVDNDRFEELFGAGVSLHSITIELTDEPITWGIEKYLPWLPDRFINRARGYISASPDNYLSDPTGLRLTGIEFSKGRIWKEN